jgi:hypothetical protein
MTMPKIVAQLMMAAEVGWSFFASTESWAVEAATSALLIWVAVKGCGPWISQLAGLAVIWNCFIACSVISVLAADVPLDICF